MSPTPFLSVVMPVHNGMGVLPDTLGALAESDLDRGRWELVLVDDASTDGTVELARRHADQVIELSGAPHGPAFARNRGAEAAKGDVLVFLDADVRIAPDALGRLARLFASDPLLGAAFGSYDDQPPAAGVVSRYRNLLHHYHHHRGAGEAETFWAGLGAVRADAFREVGGYDEVRYARPQIEDIELGRRLRRAGHRIVLDPTIQGAHLKRWTLKQVVQTDLLHRGIPWMRLLLEEGGEGAVLNVAAKEKICVALVGAFLAVLAAAAVLTSPVLLLVALVCVTIVVLWNVDLYRYLARGRGVGFGLAVVPLHLLYYVTSGMAFLFGQALHRLQPRPDGVSR